MDAILALTFGGFLFGLLVTSRTLAWIAGLHAAMRQRFTRDAGTRASPTWAAPLLLHSGPWMLALAIASVYYVDSLGQLERLWAWLGGLAGAPLFILAFVVRRPHVARAEAAPLTPERLAQRRREFFLLTMAWTSIAPTVGAAWFYWATLDRAYPIVIFVAIASLPAGWCYSWVMWQWVGTALEVGEKKRRQRVEREARAAQTGS